MQLGLSFSTLLASILLASSIDARPVAEPVGMVKLPIRRVEQRSTDVHPHVYLQQHINRGNKRLALMSGREIPSDDELRHRILKRLDAIDRPRSKRSNHVGLAGGKAPVAGLSLNLKEGDAAQGNRGGKQKNNGTPPTGNTRGNGTPPTGAGTNDGTPPTGNTGGNSTSDGTPPTGDTGGNGTPPTGNTGGNSTSAGTPPTGDTGGNGTPPAGAGTPPEGVQAANPPSAKDSLGLDIEGADLSFLATIQMGTPPRDFSILMDSGSADLWVGSENCQTAQAAAPPAGAAGLQARARGGGGGVGNGAGNGAGVGGGNGGNGRAGNGAGAGGVGAGAGNAGNGAAGGAGAGGVGAGAGNAGNGAAGAGAGGTGGNGAGAGNGTGAGAAGAGAAGCGNHKFLGPQSSSSFQDSGKAFQVTYGTGAVAGTIVQDNIVVAGLTLKAHTFGTAQQETQDFSDNSVPFDGLMGLAKSTLSEQKTLTPIEALAKQGLVKEAITSYKIPRLADNKNDGEITFGGLDSTKFDQQTLVSLPNVNKNGFWEGAMDDVTVDGQSTQLQGRTAILDTGTTLIIAPAQDAATVHKLITGAQADGQGGFVLPCTFNQTVALSFGKATFAIDPRDMIVGGQPVAQDPQTGEQLCLSGISEGNIGGAQEWLVGDVFLKNAYFSTDVGKDTVSLAKLV
ncbi:hypothetical protein E1B28_011474 [Marasmius oreades]|uniref:Peptidase A1 domain-containing protein n=1 Tax=Marasmius oreades TaxID=181124 RepID=A0A9P7RUS7_9AGAR|nr:uncharacterized protein E1B28_011474 [Marasmius oreades]KAG7089827.1 hypothetical protein E1B28_011474 [Marasmius oreades]